MLQSIRNSNGQEPVCERLWSKPFNSQAICMCYDQTSCISFVGLDDGKVIAIQLASNSNYVKFEVTMELKIHQARVMGVFYDAISGMCYSIGEDKFLKITNYQNKEIISSH